MRFSFAAACLVLLLCSLPSWGQNPPDSRLHRITEAAENLIASETPLKNLKSLTIAITYAISYKRQFQGPIESELLQKAVSKLHSAGLKVTTEPEFIKQANADLQAALHWDGKTPLPEREDVPMLIQEISTSRWVDNTTVVTISTRLSESGYLVRNPKGKRSVTSWTAPLISTAVVENGDLQSHLVTASAEQIADFVEDWKKQQKLGLFEQ